MLDAIRRATLNDDVYGEDQTTSAFEREMAAICGKEAAAFVITGTMANQLALRTLLNEAPPYAIMTDAQSRKPPLFLYVFLFKVVIRVAKSRNVCGLAQSLTGKS